MEFHSCGARRGLELVHGQLPDEAHAVIAQTPSGIVVIRGSREGTPAKNQQISAMLKKRVNGGPILLGESGAVRKDKQTGGGFPQQGVEFLGRSKARSQEGRFELLLRKCRRVCRGQAGFAQDNDGGSGFLRAAGLNKERETG